MHDLARQHMSLAVSSAARGDWKQALHHSHACRELSPVGSDLHLWSLHHLACTLVDVGRPQQARVYAGAYLRAVQPGQFPRMTAFVVRALSHVAYQEGRFVESARLRRRALAMFQAMDDTPQVERTLLNLVWSYGRAGRLAEAWQYLGRAGNSPLRHGAHALLLAAEGRWQESLAAGRLAMQGAREAHDFSDAAEVCLIVAGCLRALGDQSGAFEYIRKAAEFAARQDRDASALLLLSHRAGGGEYLHVRASVAHGSADLRHRGCYSTGVA